MDDMPDCGTGLSCRKYETDPTWLYMGGFQSLKTPYLWKCVDSATPYRNGDTGDNCDEDKDCKTGKICNLGENERDVAPSSLGPAGVAMCFATKNFDPLSMDLYMQNPILWCGTCGE